MNLIGLPELLIILVICGLPFLLMIGAMVLLLSVWRTQKQILARLDSISLPSATPPSRASTNSPGSRPFQS